MEGKGVDTNDHVLEIHEESIMDGNGVDTSDHVLGIQEGSGMEGNGVDTNDHVLEIQEENIMDGNGVDTASQSICLAVRNSRGKHNGVDTNDHVLGIHQESIMDGNGVDTSDHVLEIREGSGMEGYGVDTSDCELASLIDAEQNNIPPQNLEELCIHRVVPEFRNGNEEAYSPQMVSIGPFHRGCKNLQAMERHKLLYLNHFLNRRPEMKTNQLIRSLRGLEERARQCYGEPISLTSDEFIKMMLLDGCFIIEFLLKWDHGETRDIIMSSVLMQYIVKWDITHLVENQLPFFVLEHLFILINFPLSISFLELCLDFVYPDRNVGKSVDEPSQSILQPVKHFVDLRGKCDVPTSPRISPSQDYQLRFIPSASELHASGVKFTKDKRRCFLDITFIKDDGVFNIPSIRIEDDTNRRFRNLIALEQFDEDAQYISNYTTLMNCLIDTSDDVALLRRKGIIDNWMGDDQEVSLLFNKIGKGVMTGTDTFYYAKLFEDVNIYHQKRRHRWQATLTRDYFGTPWSIVSFLAAVSLLLCTFLQTLYVFFS